MTYVRKVVDYDPYTGLHYERTVADVEHIIENNLEHRIAGNNGWSKERTFRKVASIPIHLYFNGLKQAKINMSDEQAVKDWTMKFLRENPKFMTVDQLKTNKKHIIK